MVHEDLFARLNEAGYKNWLKAGYCLLKVKDGLCGFADSEMRYFHNTVINNNFVLQRGQRCRSSCRPRGNQFESACPVCNEWKREILRHHTKPSGVINWGNCRPWLWPTEHWELAKAFMPRGLSDLSKADQCDAAALLNLFHFCDHFSFINPTLITEVIRCRNELMHSCEMQVSNEWMTRFQKSLEHLLLTLRHVPEVAAAGQQIQEMLSVDLSLHIPGVDSVDGAKMEGVFIESISQCETELLRETLRDLLNNSELEGNIIPLEKLQNIYRFLSGHKDLEEQFRTELQRLQVLEAQLQGANADNAER
ncbi:hypothetical protein PHYPO_G00151900 [Pangasianodon hypophthalmus]|uniref:Uncharacterized protein n=1 Tax=Pangasianodon hypophthalmus TaxID=310915 RepID=A0A5N5JVY1_PANHP|nr:uncharacterized protein CXorf38 homolog [Pangasianodon hypophthalmus]KAB5523381.1 hypothetical protein PHYPO_G00151900 [Pangasianodon hypophthalmus]